MRILFATPVPPLLNKPRPHYLLRSLAARGHELHLLSQVSSDDPHRDLENAPGWKEIEHACASVTFVRQSKLRSVLQCAASLPTPVPLRVAYVRSRALTAAGGRLFTDLACDVLHGDRERLAPIFASLDAPKVLDATDSLSLYVRRTLRYGPLGERLLSALELAKAGSFERRMCLGYDRCLVTSAEDRAAIEASGGPEATVVPNGVPERYFESRHSGEPNHLVFVGTMGYAPNVDAVTWFADEIWPRVRARVASAHLTITGHDPSRAVWKLKNRAGIDVTGTVADTLTYLTRATVHVAPMRIGGGFPNKVAEALAAGVPTVSTSAGCAGLPGLVAGEHLLVADDAEGFADATVRLLEDEAVRARLTRLGRSFVFERYRWDGVAEQVEAIYEEAIGRHAKRGNDRRDRLSGNPR